MYCIVYGELQQAIICYVLVEMVFGIRKWLVHGSDAKKPPVDYKMRNYTAVNYKMYMLEMIMIANHVKRRTLIKRPRAINRVNSVFRLYYSLSFHPSIFDNIARHLQRDSLHIMLFFDNKSAYQVFASSTKRRSISINIERKT